MGIESELPPRSNKLLTIGTRAVEYLTPGTNLSVFGMSWAFYRDLPVEDQNKAIHDATEAVQPLLDKLWQTNLCEWVLIVGDDPVIHSMGMMDSLPSFEERAAIAIESSPHRLPWCFYNRDARKTDDQT